MPPDRDPSVTELLDAWGGGDGAAGDELYRVLQGELKRLASSRLKGARPGRTIHTTVLVNEVCLKLLGHEARFEGRKHFFFAAARAMHDVLVEAARKQSARKRGGDWRRVDLGGIEPSFETSPEDLLALDEVLSRLEEREPRMARLVHLRFFAGLTEAETAEVLGISESTARREWRYVRAKLYRELSDGDAEAAP